MECWREVSIDLEKYTRGYRITSLMQNVAEYNQGMLPTFPATTKQRPDGSRTTKLQRATQVASLIFNFVLSSLLLTETNCKREG